MKTKITTLIMIVVATGILVMNSCAPKNGSVTFWNTSSPNIITVSISGQANQTITSSSTATACSGSGFATFSLTPGSYNFTATDGTTNWSGSATVTAEGCLLYQLL